MFIYIFRPIDPCESPLRTLRNYSALMHIIRSPCMRMPQHSISGTASTPSPQQKKQARKARAASLRKTHNTSRLASLVPSSGLSIQFRRHSGCLENIQLKRHHQRIRHTHTTDLIKERQHMGAATCQRVSTFWQSSTA